MWKCPIENENLDPRREVRLEIGLADLLYVSKNGSHVDMWKYTKVMGQVLYFEGERS